MTRTYVRRVTAPTIVAGAYDVSTEIKLSARPFTIERITAEHSKMTNTLVEASFVYEDAKPGRQSHLGNGWSSLRCPLVLQGPFEVEGPGYIQLSYWISDVGSTMEFNVVFKRRFGDV